jgi:hypothetical protein
MSELGDLLCSCLQRASHELQGTLSLKPEISYCLYSESPLASGEVRMCTTTTPSLPCQDSHSRSLGHSSTTTFLFFVHSCDQYLSSGLLARRILTGLKSLSLSIKPEVHTIRNSVLVMEAKHLQKWVNIIVSPMHETVGYCYQSIIYPSDVYLCVAPTPTLQNLQFHLSTSSFLTLTLLALLL